MLRVLTYLSFFIGLQASGQSLLWKIQKGDTKPSYVYGTIHIQEKEVFAYDAIVEEKLKSCEQFMPELVFDEVNPALMMRYVLLPDSVSLKTLLSAQQYVRLDSFCMAKLGVGLVSFEKMQPWVMSTQLMQADMKIDMPVALDMYLTQKARDAGLKVEGLETLEEQLAAFYQIGIQEQVEMLLEGLDQHSERDIQYLKRVYLNANLDSMLIFMDDPTLSDEFEEAFLIKRNHAMAHRMDSISQLRPSFYAVGAAHLGGDTGVLNLMKEAGYKVDPIPFTFK